MIGSRNPLARLAPGVVLLTFTATLAPAADPPTELKGHPEPVVKLAVSPTGSHLAVTSKSGAIRLWDLAKGTSADLVPYDRDASKRGTRGDVLEFGSDGRTLVAGIRGETQLWEVATGRMLTTVRGNAVAASPASVAVVLASVDKATFQVWDLAADKMRLEFTPENKNHAQWRFAVSADGRQVVFAEANTSDRPVRRFDVAAGKEVEPIRGLKRVEDLALSGNGQFLACATEIVNADFGLSVFRVADLAGKARLVDQIDQGTQFKMTADQAKARFIAPRQAAPGAVTVRFERARNLRFGDDGQVLFFDSQYINEPNVVAWDFANRTLTGSGPVTGPTTRGGALIVGRAPTGLAVLKAADFKLHAVVEIEAKLQDKAGGVAVAPDGRWVAYGTADGTVQIRPLAAAAAGTESRVIRPAFPKGATATPFDAPQRLHFSPDGKWLMLLGADTDTTYGRLVGLIRVETGEATFGTANISGWYWPKEGTTLRGQFYAPGQKNPNRELNLATGKLQPIPSNDLGDLPNWFTYARAISPDGTVTAGVLQPHTAAPRDIPRVKRLALLDETGTKITAVLGDEPTDTERSALIFSPDGKSLAVRAGTKVRLWDLAAKKDSPIRFQPCDDGVYFAGDNDTLVTIKLSDDRGPSGFVHDLASGQLDRTISLKTGHTGRVRAAAFSRAAPVFVTVGENGEVLLKDLKTGNVTRRLEGHSGTVLSATFTDDGKLLATTGEDKTIRLWAIPPR